MNNSDLTSNLSFINEYAEKNSNYFSNAVQYLNSTLLKTGTWIKR